MMSIYKDPERVRVSAKITTNYIPKTLKFQQFYIYKYLSTYNNLDTAIKKKSITSFKNDRFLDKTPPEISVAWRKMTSQLIRPSERDRRP